jgi:hypothetical protein
MNKTIEEIEFNIETVSSVDIPTMFRMTEDEYINYVKGDNLLFVDHHDVLRSGKTGRPFATTARQMDLFIEFLQFQRSKMSE